MKNMTEAFLEFCNKKDIQLRQSDNHTFHLVFSGKHTRLKSLIVIDDNKGEIVMETFLPVKVTAEKLPAVYEIMARLNPELRNGYLKIVVELDCLCYRTNLLLGRCLPQDAMFEHLILTNWLSADFNFPVIVAVVLGNIAPKEVMCKLTRWKDAAKAMIDQNTSSVDSDVISRFLGKRMRNFMNN